MDIDQFQFLLTEHGQKLLQEASATTISAANHLQIASQLRSQIDPVLAQAVIEIALLRQLAAVKFSRADQMYFTRPALEQASGEAVSKYRADRFFQAGCNQIVELGCGIGGDSISLTAQADVTGIDIDPLHLHMARENVLAYSFGERFQGIEGDLNTIHPLPAEALFFDPARRTADGRRIKSVDLYQPPLNLIDKWRESTPHAAVKISPGVAYEELPAGCEVEFISLKGQVKECVLWYGDLSAGTIRKGTLLPGKISLTSRDYPGADVPVTNPSAYLYEPDGAIIRAHLVQQVARALSATQIDREIAYLTADTMSESPFARCYRLDDWFPFHLKRLRQYLRERHIGRVTIKKRGSPIEPEYLNSQLRLKGSEHRYLFLTHVAGKAAVLIGRDPTNP